MLRRGWRGVLISTLLATACTDRALGPEDPSQPGQPTPSQPAPTQPGQPAPTQPDQPAPGDSVHGIRFYPDIQADLNRLSCTTLGACHGGAQAPFWVPFPHSQAERDANYQAFVDEANPAAPTQSLVLLKATGVDSHTGGALMKTTDPTYQRWVDWIGGGEPE
jgi:hypothetical protein